MNCIFIAWNNNNRRGVGRTYILRTDIFIFSAKFNLFSHWNIDWFCFLQTWPFVEENLLIFNTKSRRQYSRIGFKISPRLPISSLTSKLASVCPSAEIGIYLPSGKTRRPDQNICKSEVFAKNICCRKVVISAKQKQLSSLKICKIKKLKLKCKLFWKRIQATLQIF